MTPDADPGGHPLDNPIWHALTTRHRQFAISIDACVRYDPEISVFGSVESFADGWADLSAAANATGVVVAFGADRELHDAPAEVHSVEVPSVQMVFTGTPTGPVDPRVEMLGPDDVDAMGALVALAQPGPFTPRTAELGRYVGIRDGGQLVAMAGERLSLAAEAGGFTEVSAVCTHPDAQGHGLGAAITLAVVDHILSRGDTAILHHVAENERAHSLYERLGFETRRAMPVTAILRQ